MKNSLVNISSLSKGEQLNMVDEAEKNINEVIRLFNNLWDEDYYWLLTGKFGIDLVEMRKRIVSNHSPRETNDNI